VLLVQVAFVALLLVQVAFVARAGRRELEADSEGLAQH
jgi:hypothetical protein